MNFFDRTNRILDVGNVVKVTKSITIVSLLFGAIAAAVLAIVKYL